MSVIYIISLVYRVNVCPNPLFLVLKRKKLPLKWQPEQKLGRCCWQLNFLPSKLRRKSLLAASIRLLEQSLIQELPRGQALRIRRQRWGRRASWPSAESQWMSFGGVLWILLCLQHSFRAFAWIQSGNIRLQTGCRCWWDNHSHFSWVGLPVPSFSQTNLRW